MCFDEKTSWTTFIVATLINIVCISNLLQSKNKNAIVPIALILLWQYAILMQIPDALAWRNQDSKVAPKLACFLNTTQPIVALLLILFLVSRTGHSIALYPAVIVVVAYTISIIIDIKKSSFNIRPVGSCKNLTYSWWKLRSLVLYFTALILTILVIPVSSVGAGILVFNIAIFIISFVVTRIIIGKNCSNSSLWCWSIAGAGLGTFLYYKNISLRCPT